MTRFKHVAITGKLDDARVHGTLAMLAAHLRQVGCEVLVEERLSRASGPLTGCEALPESVLIPQADLVISIGGDGTLLHTARLLAGRPTPLLGVNLGRLGFLVDASPERIDDVAAVLEGHYVIDSRMLISAEIVACGSDTVLASGLALNDVVIHRWNTARMIELEVRADGELVTRLRSDGLILATPTGSTAYAMASGGPIVHPAVDALLIVPVSPHSLSNRPLVLPATTQLEIAILEQPADRVQISCDGQDELPIVSDTVVRIRRSTARVNILHPAGYRYFEILRAKLHWGDGGP